MLPTVRSVFACCFAGLLLSAGPVAAQIERSTSEVTGVERLKSSEMRTLVAQRYPGHASFQAEYTTHPEDGHAWRLFFYGFTEDTTEMSRSSNVRLTADGKPVTPARIESKIRRLDGSLMEVKTAEFTQSEFKTIATADDVFLSIGRMRFELTYHFRRDMRLILKRPSFELDPPTASRDSTE